MSDFFRIHTPTGGWTGEMPGPFLTNNCDGLVDGAPDLRGTWRPVAVSMNGEPAPKELPLWSHVERIEQCGARVIVTSDGIIHDFPIADGTVENGCHDVAAIDKITPIRVAGSFENGVFILRPEDMPGVEVHRWRDGDYLMWKYHTMFEMKMERIA